MRHPSTTALAAWALCLGVWAAGAISPSAAAAQASDEAGRDADPASGAVGDFAAWVVASSDNHGLPFVIIDKVAAEVLVFAADGQPRGAAPALLGLAPGDDSAPGVGDRKLSAIPPEERTTPAGRFLTAFGVGAGGKTVLWVDYQTAISLHPVINSKKERRLQRLATLTPDDNRITFGCINVPAAFYEEVVRPAFTGTNGVVYILPETRALAAVFPAFRVQTASASPGPVDGVAPIATGR